MISLRPGWEGIVVPSKFFGALAIGRPVLFSGTADSDIANWCREYEIGYELDDNFTNTLKKLLETPELLSKLQQKAFKIYNEHFSKEVVVRDWKNLLDNEK